MDMLIDCQHLTLEEKRRILQVLQKDDAVQQAELAKVKALKDEIKEIRHKAIIKSGDDPEKICIRCRGRFGWIFDRGNLCPKCHSKVCEKCQMPLDNPGQWLCRLCFKKRELDKVSGNWLKKSAKRKGVGREKLVPGNILVKASIKKELGISSSYCTCRNAKTSNDCYNCLIKFTLTGENKSAADDLREALSSEGSPVSQRSHLSSQDGGSTGETNTQTESKSRIFSDLVNFRVPGMASTGQQNGEIRRQKACSRHRSESSDSDEELPEMPDLIPSGRPKKPGSRTSEYSQRSGENPPGVKRPSDRHLDLKNNQFGNLPGTSSQEDSFDVEDLTKVKFHRVSKHRAGDRTPSPCGGHARSSSDSSSDAYLEDEYLTLQDYYQEHPSSESDDEFSEGHELQKSHEFTVYVGNSSFIYHNYQNKLNANPQMPLTKSNPLPAPTITITDDSDVQTQSDDLDVCDGQGHLSPQGQVDNNGKGQGHSNQSQGKVKNKGRKKPPPVSVSKGGASGVFKRAVVNIMRARSLLLSQHSSDEETDTTTGTGSLSSIKEEGSDLSDKEGTIPKENDDVLNEPYVSPARILQDTENSPECLPHDNRVDLEISHPESGYCSSLSTSQPKSQELDDPSRDHLQKRLSDASGVSVPSIEVTHPHERGKDDDEDIDELVKSHKSSSSLLTPHGSDAESNSSIHPASSVGSKESITSYYSDAGEGLYGMIPVQGELQFGLDYNYKTGTFIINLKQCRDLSFADEKKKRTDPYVKVYLLPDKTRTGKRKSKVKKNTVNPQFDEQIRYTLCKSELESRTLWISVWHNDMFGRNAFLGEVMMPMDYHEFQDPTPEWHQLQERKQPSMSFLSYKGDMVVAIKFVPPEKMNITDVSQVDSSGELHVCVKEARNLTAVRANGYSDPFVKAYLLPNKAKQTKQKTPTVKKNCNPKWNSVLKFDNVSLEDLPHKCLELTVWDHDRISSNQFLGGARLNLGQASALSSEVDWMDAKGEEVSIWQGMLDRPNMWVEGSIMLRPTMDKRL